MDRLQGTQKRWQSVRDWIVRQIDSGEWPAQSKLPSIRGLARLFDTSITTVQRALSDLEANAYVLSVPRVGYFTRAPGPAAVSRADFASVTVNVNQAVVTMLAQAAASTTPSLSSAVLQGELTPHVQLSKCLAVLAAKGDPGLSGLVPPPGWPRCVGALPG